MGRYCFSYFSIIIICFLTSCGKSNESNQSLSFVKDEILVEANLSSTHVIELKNESEETLQIDSISGSCSCLIIESKGFMLEPNALKKISLTYNGKSDIKVETLTFILQKPLRFEQLDISIVQK